MIDPLLLATLDRLENKIDELARDVKTIQLEQSELRGIRKTILYLGSSLGGVSGAFAGFLGHHFGIW